MNPLVFAQEMEPSAWDRLWDAFPYVAWAAFLLALLSIPSVLVRRQGRPQAALSWVLILFALPLVGMFLWWAIGRSHLARKRRKRRRTAAAMTQRKLQFHEELPPKPQAQWELLPLERLPAEDAEWAFPPTRDNQTRLLIDAQQAYPEIERMVREAQDFIHIIFYIWQPDTVGERFRDLLIQKARAGVEVRLLLDAFGSSPSVKRFMNPLREAGGQVAIFGPAILRRWHLEFNFRNHRKLVLVDGQTAVVGGLNIGEEYTKKWHDLALQLQGPVLDQLQEVFVEDWAFAKGADFVGKQYFGRWKNAPCDDRACKTSLCAVIASGPHSLLNLTHEVYLLAIADAKERVWLTSPYFVPDPTLLSALRTAVLRGVDVRALIPAEPDAWIVGLASRSYYTDLLRAGIRIFEYSDNILHAKTAVIDRDIACVGSANMDVRSFKLNFELSCFLKCEELCRQLSDLFEQDCAKSHEVQMDEVKRRGYWTQVAEAAAHLLSPLL